eukprot:1162322-Amphidinium_carterae.1
MHVHGTQVRLTFRSPVSAPAEHRLSVCSTNRPKCLKEPPCCLVTENAMAPQSLKLWARVPKEYQESRVEREWVTTKEKAALAERMGLPHLRRHKRSWQTIPAVFVRLIERLEPHNATNDALACNKATCCLAAEHVSSAVAEAIRLGRPHHPQHQRPHNKSATCQ